MTFEPNPEFNKRALYLEPVWEEILTVKGEEALDLAKGFAAPHTKTGSFEAHMHGDFHRASNSHPFYRVENDDPAALSIEFGTAKAEGEHALGKAIDAMERP